MSADGMLLCTTSDEKSLKVFDIMSFGMSLRGVLYDVHWRCVTDMINMVMNLAYVPISCEWVSDPSRAAKALIAW